jgi:hypothetical protein
MGRRDRNRNDLDIVYFKLMTSPGDLCSGQLSTVDFRHDEGFGQEKSRLTERSSGADIQPLQDFVIWNYLNHWWRPFLACA